MNEYPQKVIQNDLASMRLLLRWIQHEAKKPDEKRYTLDAIAEIAMLSRDKLNKFLANALSDDEALRRYHTMLEPVRGILEDQNEVSRPVRVLMERVFGPRANVAQDAVIGEPRVWTHEALAKPNLSDNSLIEPMFGLSLLVRVANEVVQGNDGRPDYGWSISLLNVPPAHIQEGFYHPLFKLRQRGLNRAAFDIHGVVIAQTDRLIFQGVDDLDGKPFNTTLMLATEDWRNFRAPPKPESAIVSGVMLGLSSARAPFGGLFDLIAVPGSVVEKGASAVEQKEFDDLYLQARNATGVRNLKETLQALKDLGVKIKQGELEELREKSRRSLLFSAN